MSSEKTVHSHTAAGSHGGDGQIVARLRGGDETAFLNLVEQYGPPMLRFASRHLTPAAAEDVVQDAWIGVLQGVARFEERSSLKTWIFSILMNRIRTQAARERRTLPFSALAEETAGSDPALPPDRFLGTNHPESPYHWAVPPKSWGDSPEDRLLSEEVRAQIQRAIDALPTGQREVITLSDVEGWTAEEVCDLLRITPANQRVLLHRARSKVRHALERYFEEAA